jgi:hypothetical protein
MGDSDATASASPNPPLAGLELKPLVSPAVKGDGPLLPRWGDATVPLSHDDDGAGGATCAADACACNDGVRCSADAPRSRAARAAAERRLQ